MFSLPRSERGPSTGDAGCTVDLVWAGPIFSRMAFTGPYIRFPASTVRLQSTGNHLRWWEPLLHTLP